MNDLTAPLMTCAVNDTRSVSTRPIVRAIAAVNVMASVNVSIVTFAELTTSLNVAVSDMMRCEVRSIDAAKLAVSVSVAVSRLTADTHHLFGACADVHVL